MFSSFKSQEDRAQRLVGTGESRYDIAWLDPQVTLNYMSFLKFRVNKDILESAVLLAVKDINGIVAVLVGLVNIWQGQTDRCTNFSLDDINIGCIVQNLG